MHEPGCRDLGFTDYKQQIIKCETKLFVIEKPRSSCGCLLDFIIICKHLHSLPWQHRFIVKIALASIGFQ